MKAPFIVLDRHIGQIQLSNVSANDRLEIEGHSGLVISAKSIPAIVTALAIGNMDPSTLGTFDPYDIMTLCSETGG